MENKTILTSYVQRSSTQKDNTRGRKHNKSVSVSCVMVVYLSTKITILDEIKEYCINRNLNGYTIKRAGIDSNKIFKFNSRSRTVVIDRKESDIKNYELVIVDTDTIDLIEI